MTTNKCRICGKALTEIFPLGKMPIVNYYPSKTDLEKKGKKFPLTFCVCTNCSLAQLKELVSPKDIFTKYHYASSTSAPLKTHLERLAQLIRKRFSLTKDSYVLDIGCNDGILLKELSSHSVQVMGVDPAENIVENISSKKIPIKPFFFSLALSEKIKKETMFDVIVATNTLAQIIDIDDFVEGVKNILKPNGTFVVEVGYLLAMIQKKTFDSIYHEHFSYFSLTSLNFLFKKHELVIFDAQKIPNHGGSLRVFVSHINNKKKQQSRSFLKILNEEKKHNLYTADFYNDFVVYCNSYKNRFKKKILNLKKNNKSIVGVGSPAKGVILLNFCGIDSSLIDYVVDSTPYKQYRFMPGTHIPIFPENEIDKRKTPDYLLLLAWTYKEIFLQKLEKYRKKGTKIILPLPTYSVIS